MTGPGTAHTTRPSARAQAAVLAAPLRIPGSKSIRVYETRVRWEWFDMVYVPRYLLVYTLSEA